MIQQRLACLRNEMQKRNIAVYIVPTSDFHESEYVGEYFKARQFISGFTGSAGVAVITLFEAKLWTDGRYFIQAQKQLEGTTITLMKMGQEGVPTVDEYIENILSEKQVLAFDGRVINGTWGTKLKKIADRKKASVYDKEDLIDIIWNDRPPLAKNPAIIFEQKYAGESTAVKLLKVRDKMKEYDADIHLLSSLTDIAWLLNIRGSDISYVPVVLSYLSISNDECIWFIQEEILTEELEEYLDDFGIKTAPYNSFYEYVSSISSNKKVLMDCSVINYRICNCIPDGVEILDKQGPTVVMKAIKNNKQIDNLRKAHTKDAVAMIKFMYWLKTNIGKDTITEISASDYLSSLRQEQEGFLDLSFDTISGYAEHGAIVHYSATSETDIELKPEGLLLVDSGGHYLEGTTDITRTFALGPLTDEMKADFTRVCRANINLAATQFRYGCSGYNLDIIARQPFWEAGLDFNHGTGHGVGYVLNVHEGPNGFRWRVPQNASEICVLEEGMVTTDEPGIYIEGKYGIRTENELVCRKGIKNEYGQFMYFENLTYVPIDLDAIEPDQMSAVEKDRLNDYHAFVYEKMSPYFDGDELEFLKKYTRAI
ncbi:MAG: aminopeptidase P family protein [Agathobacter sp.]|nr:aminopeptidase P family protein [Agathobacter sp.]